MRVAVSSTGPTLDSPVDLRFGRCPYFLVVDMETMAYEAIPNPHMAASGGAGIQAAQLVGNRGVQAVITGIPGPNAFQTLQAIGIPIYQSKGGTVRQAVEDFKQGRLVQVAQPGPSYAGMGFGGPGRGWGGRGMGRGRWFGAPIPPPPGVQQPPVAPAGNSELSSLKQQAEELKRQLEQITERIRQLEEKEG